MKTFTPCKSYIGFFRLLSLDLLLPHEEIDPEHLQMLQAKIVSDNAFLKPIVIDNLFRIILDGHHRWHALKSLGFSKIPVVEVDIFHAELDVLPFREDIPVSRELVIEYATSGRLFPSKTTGHVWGNDKKPIKEVIPDINIRLSLLK